MLTDDFRPLQDPTGAQRPPKHPRRLKAFELACGLYAAELEAQMAGARAGG